MSFLVDLHLHSYFSRATARGADLAGYAAWALVKGVHWLATGDVTHPGWLAHLERELAPAEPGLWRLRQAPPPAIDGLRPPKGAVRFLLSGEISCVFKQDGATRRVHCLVLSPDFGSLKKLNARLGQIGNLQADGRPILKLPLRDLLEIQLETVPQGFLVPAHIWTPWYALLGAKSGFDSPAQAFGDLKGEVFTLETGLGSSPEMNRRVSALDGYTLVSNSDAHSPHRLGRQANRLEIEPDFAALKAALKTGAGFEGTVETFPELGKYFWDGHRKCGVAQDPRESARSGGSCPVCSRPLTQGSAARLEQLADRKTPLALPPTEQIVPLPDLLGYLLGVGVQTKKVRSAYVPLIERFGPELEILRHQPLGPLEEALPGLGAAIGAVRAGGLTFRPGADGVYGRFGLEPQAKSLGNLSASC